MAEEGTVHDIEQDATDDKQTDMVNIISLVLIVNDW